MAGAYLPRLFQKDGKYSSLISRGLDARRVKKSGAWIYDDIVYKY